MRAVYLLICALAASNALLVQPAGTALRVSAARVSNIDMMARAAPAKKPVKRAAPKKAVVAKKPVKKVVKKAVKKVVKKVVKKPVATKPVVPVRAPPLENISFKPGHDHESLVLIC